MTDERCLRTAVVMTLMSCFDSYFISLQRTVLLFRLDFFFLCFFFTLIELQAALFCTVMHCTGPVTKLRSAGGVV